MVAARERVLTAGLVDDVRPGCRTRPHSVDRRVRWPFQLPDTPRTPWRSQGPVHPATVGVGPDATSKGAETMTTLLIFHEVDDVAHWLKSTRREEFFGPLGMTARTFVDPGESNRVGLIAEVPDLETFQKAMESEAAAEAMKYDGVRPDTIVMLVES
jgi:hypothetical protein